MSALRPKLIVLALLTLLTLGTGATGAWLAPHRVPLLWRLAYTSHELGEGIHPSTAAALAQLRVCTKRRFRLRSGWRSPAHNRRVGGASDSQHLHGLAVDLTVPHAHRDALYRCATAAGFTGFGWGSTSTHLDLGRARWWTYDDRGRALSGAAATAHLHKAPPSFRLDRGLN